MMIELEEWLRQTGRMSAKNEACGCMVEPVGDERHKQMMLCSYFRGWPIFEC